MGFRYSVSLTENNLMLWSDLIIVPKGKIASNNVCIWQRMTCHFKAVDVATVLDRIILNEERTANIYDFIDTWQQYTPPPPVAHQIAYSAPSIFFPHIVILLAYLELFWFLITIDLHKVFPFLECSSFLLKLFTVSVSELFAYCSSTEKIVSWFYTDIILFWYTIGLKNMFVMCVVGRYFKAVPIPPRSAIFAISCLIMLQELFRISVKNWLCVSEVTGRT